MILHILMLVNIILLYGSCILLNGILTKGIIEKRVDLQPPPLLRKQRDKDHFRNQSDKESLPLAWLMSFPVSHMYFVFCPLKSLCVSRIGTNQYLRTPAHPTRAISSGLSPDSLLRLIIKVKTSTEASLYSRNSLKGRSSLIQMENFQTLFGRQRGFF